MGIIQSKKFKHLLAMHVLILLMHGFWWWLQVNKVHSGPGYYNGLLPICQEFLQFSDESLQENENLLSFHTKHCSEKYHEYNFFLELSTLVEDEKSRDVILMHKVLTIVGDIFVHTIFIIAKLKEHLFYFFNLEIKTAIHRTLCKDDICRIPLQKKTASQ